MGAVQNNSTIGSPLSAREGLAGETKCQSAGITFIPITFEALGGMSALAADTIAKIGRLLGQRLGIPPQAPPRHIFQRLSVSPGKATLPL